MKTNNQPFNFYFPTQDEKKKLEEWLNLWHIKQKLENSVSFNEVFEINDENDKEFKDSLKNLIREFDDNPKVGEIRLLSPEFDKKNSLPKYILVLSEQDNNTFLIAPFSPFSVTATPEEFQTKKEHFSLSVIELWNTMTVPLKILKQSWLVDNCSEEQISDSLTILNLIADNKSLPVNLKERVGPPIFFQKDPRNQYLKEEKEEYSLLRNLSKKLLQNDSSTKITSYQTVENKIKVKIGKEQIKDFTLMAAGSADKAELSIPYIDFEIVVEWDEAEKVTLIWIRGERATEICSKNNELTVVFKNGEKITHHFDNNKNIFLKIPKKDYPISEIKFSMN